MTFQPTKPAAGDYLAESQVDLKNNFSTSNTYFGTDHIAFNEGSDQGEHKKVTFNDVLGADPGLASPKCSLYTKTIAGDSELFFEKFDNTAGANLVQQMTNLNITNLGNGGTAGGTLYEIASPLGCTIYCGKTAGFSGNATVTFPAAFTTILTSIATANDTNVQKISTVSAVGGLTLYTENLVSVNWIAIGI